MRSPRAIMILVGAALGGSSVALAGAPYCGDGKVRGGEQCDGSNLSGQTCETLGYAGGTLACVACAFDTSGCTTGGCGDGALDGYEECDGTSDAACPGQ